MEANNKTVADLIPSGDKLEYTPGEGWTEKVKKCGTCGTALSTIASGVRECPDCEDNLHHHIVETEE